MSRLVTLGRVAAIFCALGLAACSGGSGDDGDDDVQLQADASGGDDQIDAAPQVECPTDFAAVGPLAGAMATSGPIAADSVAPAVGALPAIVDPTTISLQGAVEVGPPLHVAFVDLWDGYGAFKQVDGGDEAGKIKNGEFTLGGDEADFATCGVCLTLYTGVDSGSGSAEHVFIAQSGTVTITSVAGNLIGSMAAVEFAEIDQASDAGGLLAGGCAVSVASAEFDGAITAE